MLLSSLTDVPAGQAIATGESCPAAVNAHTVRLAVLASEPA